MFNVSLKCGTLTSFLFVCTDCSGGERHVHPAATGDAQFYAAEAPGAHHLPHRGGREQCVWQGGRDADVVHRHQSHTGPSEGRQGASFSLRRFSLSWCRPLILSCVYMKEFLVALRLQGATMRHYMTQTDHSWHEQVRGFQMTLDSLNCTVVLHIIVFPRILLR